LTQSEAPSVYGEMLIDLGAGRTDEAGAKAAALIHWMRNRPGGWPGWLTRKRIANVADVYTTYHRKPREVLA
jgi:hypothetical protein